MAESDDEYDRKRRDKFRGERSSGGDNYRSDRRDDRRGRDDWPDRRRQDYREYRPRDRFSPDRGPPMKRMRNDWPGDDRRYHGHDGFGGGGYGGWMHEPGYPPHGGGHLGGGGFGGGPPSGGIHGRLGGNAAEPLPNPDLQTQPAMLTLKQFLATQDDSISDSDAIDKYNEYKVEFKRQQLNEFFVAHKDEEWFKLKYHPEDSQRRKQEQLDFLKRRTDVFSDVLHTGQVTSVNVDTNQTDKLLRLLDTVVIKLEGGTDEDLKVLDEKPNIEQRPEPVKELLTASAAGATAAAAAAAATNAAAKIAALNAAAADPAKSDDGAINENDDDSNDVKEVEMTPVEANADDQKATNVDEKPSKKRKRTTSGSSSSSSSSTSSSDDEEDEEQQEKVPTEAVTENDNDASMPESKPAVVAVNDDDEPMAEVKNDEGLNNGSPDEEETRSQKNEADDSKELADGEIADLSGDESKAADAPETIDLAADSKSETDEKPGARALHKTSSIFLRNLAPTITKSEVEAMCKRYNGFLRVAIADPLVERRWFRRGWVTFKRDTNIKEICWNLNNIRLRDCELGAIVNRDLSRRVRPVNGITAHKTIVRSDIKLCAKIAHNLDQKANLWTDDSAGGSANGNQVSFGLNSNNPVLQNITDYLIEEASAEEDELLGLSSSESKDIDGETLERDPQLINVLDKLILYLRIVHSVDFYNHCEYPYEDEMPNRCGIIHARGPPPQNKVTTTEIQEYTRNFENKMSSFLTKSEPIPEAELKKLGCKDTDAEVEKFVQANTQELAKDKWLCPLSGKKFKGPEFIRKHIFNKHGEKVDEVMKEVEYFNNYLKDPKRPQLPEHPGSAKKAPIEAQPPASMRPSYPGPGYGAPYGGYGGHAPAPMRARGGFGGRREMPMDHQRRIIGYQDLDAPVDFDSSIFS